MDLLSIKVHCWGGFGSQIFALLQYRNLSALFPKRQIVLVFHSSGVTRRTVEIECFLAGVSWRFIDDFASPEASNIDNKTNSYFRDVKRKLKPFGKLILSRFGFLSLLESKCDLMRIRPWVSSVRGHYSHFEYEKRLFLELLSEFKDFSTLKEFANSYNELLVIQYRLGDLLTITSKEFVSPEILDRAIRRIVSESQHQKNILILTDSPDYVIKHNTELTFNFDSVSLTPVDTIFASVLAKHFIGTNSKLSLLIAMLREVSGKKSLIPISFKNQINLWNPTSSLVSYY